MFCFFHDQFIEEEHVTVSINDRGFNLGDGVFDTQLAVNGQLHDADYHFTRLIHDAEIMGITFDKTVADLHTIATMLISRNGLAGGRWIVRTQITRGVAPRGLAPPDDANPTFIMRAIPAPPASRTPIRAIIAQTTRRNEHSPLSRIKSLNYADNILALMEAKDVGVDDAILLNSQGHITCMSSSNIFIVENGHWVTPPLSDGVLPGITRLWLLAEHKAREEHITVERLQNADEIIQCNSVIGTRQIILQ